jgi:ParB-like nuclease domain
VSEWTKRPIGTLRPNPDNPRIVKDERFKRLVESIRKFPQMLELRPVVITDDGMILGGNMRHQAALNAGLKEIPVVIASNLTPEQQREFVIKDNVAAGEWNWDKLANEWNLPDLGDWGLSEVNMFSAAATEPERDIDLPNMNASAESYLNNTIRQIVLHYDRETHADVLERLSVVGEAFDIEDDNSSVVLALLEFWERQRT